jgi:hypothetical protein
MSFIAVFLVFAAAGNLDVFGQTFRGCKAPDIFDYPLFWPVKAGLRFYYFETIKCKKRTGNIHILPVRIVKLAVCF